MFHNVAYFESLGKFCVPQFHSRPVNKVVPAMAFSEHHFLTPDGLSLYYRSYGPGENVMVCLPGLTRNSKDFHEIATHLSSRYRVLCPDMRGRGQSDWDPDWRNYHPATYINDTWGLVDHLGIASFTILGTSLGGLMAMILASQQPERIKAVILNDVGPEADPAGYARILASFDEQIELKEWLDAILHCKQSYQSALPDMPDEFWQAYVHKNYRQGKDGRPELEYDSNIGEAIRKGDLSQIAGIQVDPWTAFKGVTMPCLVLRGELSDILSAEVVERMADVKPDLATAVIPNRGHAPLLHESGPLAAIDGFLDNLGHKA
jgi:pimeloyl-ACP methyl ester carboxylesterase